MVFVGWTRLLEGWSLGSVVSMTNKYKLCHFLRFGPLLGGWSLVVVMNSK